ncbi:CotH kinase family protein [Streptomyces spongiae]|uniref:CotH kinase family protein n=1 Tax=Streptomyces spongiae TaxID=565072 RepID=UPI001D155C9E|nr:CotH kinase family protein [Streptomyces spongiae]
MAGEGLLSVSLSADKPQELPWLIKIDEYVEGRAYQGHQQFSLRPGSDENLPLNEAVSLELLDSSDQNGLRYGVSTVTVNNGEAATRLFMENPDKGYVQHTLGDNGVLYKSYASSSFAYEGDDPTAYEDSFKQVTKKRSQNLQPVIDLIKWVETASDEEFAEDLEEHLDVESFAKYAATQNLLLNFDDMSGPGRNYYLWYDLDTKKFTVLGWDFNATFSGSTDAGPEDEISMGGMGGADGMEMPEGGSPAEAKAKAARAEAPRG